MFCHLPCPPPVAATWSGVPGSQVRDLAECLPNAPPSFKRRGHSIGGVPEQRYQSLPVCVAARLPAQAQDVLVSTELGPMGGVLMWGLWAQGWAEEARETR